MSGSVDGDPVAAVRGRILRFVPGLELPADVAAALAAGTAGVSLYRHVNDGLPDAVRAFGDAIHAAAASGGHGPALVATDQEGGQLIGLGTGTTPFAGAMAIGATGDPELAGRVGRATGLELRALGVTVDYAPVCDLASNPANPALGIRSFGSDPERVGAFAAATVRGLQSAGVAAAPKHFPGLGAAAADSHFGLPVIDRSRDALERDELVPFRAAIAAGARGVMSAHVALPGLTGSRTLPATLARPVMHGLLRDELAFDGVVITDALDMGALVQGREQGADVVAALRAGIDLLLCGPDPASSGRVVAALTRAASSERFETGEVAASAHRLAVLRAWLGSFEAPDPSVLGCAEHRALAAELAARSITLVRNDAGLLPLRLAADASVVVVEPAPSDLTPADTSSYTAPGGLVAAVRARHPRAVGIVFDQPPGAAQVAEVREACAGADLVVLGTISAHLDPAQAALARAVLAVGRPTVTVALRTPWDLLAYAEARTHVCAYGNLPPTLDALVAALWGDAEATGRLPVAIAGLYERGHGVLPTGR